MEREGRDNARFWDRRSKVYDKEVLAEYGSAYKKTVKRSLNFLNPEDRVLEIGCGTGNGTLPLAERVKSITALDTSEKMLELAREKARIQGRENIDFLRGSLEEFEAKPGSFDAVAAYNVLLYMKDQERVLDRIHELLKPGGIFLSATDCLGRSFSKVAFRKFYRSKLGLMPYVSFETPVGLMRKIQRRGFLVLEIVNLHKNPPNIFLVAQKIEKDL